MKIAITGGLGFIGTAIAERLRADNHSVLVTDIANVPKEQLVDITEPEDCVRLCRGADVVIHGAAIHNAEIVYRDPINMMRANVEGTANIVEAAANEGVRRIVYLSTGKIYGNAGGRPSCETDMPRPKDLYALSKLVGEYYFRQLHASHGLECAMMRPFSVYGPGQDLRTGYIGMVIDALLKSTAVSLPGEAGFVRDFVHIQDVASICCLAATEDLPGFSELNAASGRGTQLSVMADILSSVFGQSLTVDYRTPRPGTLIDSCGEMQRANEYFNFQPEFELERGLLETAEWFRENPVGRREDST